MCQARMPSQSPSLGACANVQGQGMVHLQTSNQSPSRCQPGTSAMPPPSLGLGGFFSSSRAGSTVIDTARGFRRRGKMSKYVGALVALAVVVGLAATGAGGAAQGQSNDAFAAS